MASSADHLKFLLNRNDPSDLLSIQAYDDEDEYFVMDDNHIGFSLICQPLIGMDNSTFNMLKSCMSINYPDHSFLQFSLFASPNINPYINEFVRQRNFLNTPVKNVELLQEILAQQTDWMRDSAKNGVGKTYKIQLRDFINIVTFKMPVAHVLPNDKELNNYRQVKQEFVSTLASSGMCPIVCNEELMLQLYKNLLNWGDAASWRDGKSFRVKEDVEFRDQVFDLDTEIGVDKDYITLGDTHVRMMSMTNWPSELHISNMPKLIGDALLGSNGIKNNFLYNLNIYFPPEDDFKSKLARKRQVSNHSAFGSMVKHAPRIARQKQSHDIMYESMQDGASPIMAYLQIVHFADSKEELDSITGNARAVYRTANFDIQTDPNFCFPLFLNSLPLNSQREAIHYLDRYHTMTTDHVLHILPVISDWKGQGAPIMSFISRQGQLMSYDMFSGSVNYNFLICAQSGSGKSTLANEMTNNYLSHGAHAWIIDNGGSYKKLCELIGGDYIDFGGEGTPPNLNPFPLIRHLSEHEDMLVNQLIAMAFFRDIPTDFQDANLRIILNDLWEKYGKDTTISHIAEECTSSNEDLIVKMGQQLFPFTHKGTHGHYFHGDHPITYQGGLTVLELGSLSGSKHLQQVVLLQLISQVTHHIGNMDRGIRKLLLIDECWALFKLSDISAFLETSWRTIRKFGGSAGAITQSVNDVYNSKSGVSIAENSETIFLLNQKESTIDQLRKNNLLPMSEYEYKLLKSVSTVAGEYSEIFIYNDRATGIGRLYLDRFRQLLYSTTPQEVSAIQHAQAADNCSIKEAILRVMREEGSLPNTHNQDYAA